MTHLKLRNLLINTLKKVKFLLLSLSLVQMQLVYSQDLDQIQKIKDEALKQVDFSDNLMTIINEKGSEPVSLTQNDREALKLLGYSDDEINTLQNKDLFDKNERDKFLGRVDQYADKKNNEIYQGTEETLIPGLASAVIGLGFASLFGVVVGIKCRNQPSALAFAGTSAAWAGLEMMIWKGYQVEMDDIQTLMDATKIPDKISKNVTEMRSIIQKLEADIKTANASNYDQILQKNKKELNRLKEMALSLRDYLNKAKDSQFGAVRSIQQSLELAAETTEKKSKNAKVAAIGFTAAAGVATAETFKAFGDGGKCFGSKSVFNQATQKILDFIIPSAHAKFANIGDLDKIGIPLGAGLGAAYLHFEKSFADKVFNSAPTRAAVFLAMAALAYYASTKLKEASEFLRKQANEMNVFATSIENALNNLNAGFDSVQEIINEIKNQLLPAYDELVENLKNSEEIKNAISEVKDKINSTDTQALTEDIKQMISSEVSENEQSINEGIQKAKSELSQIDSSEYKLPQTTFHPILDFLFTDAYASHPGFQVKPSCFKRSRYYLKMDEDCSCLKNKTCMKTHFPERFKLSRTGDFIKLATQFAHSSSQANNYILSGRPDVGLKIYKKISATTSQVEKKSIGLLYTKVSKSISPKGILNLTTSAKKITEPALADYFKKRKLKPAPQQTMSKLIRKTSPTKADTQKRNLLISLQEKARQAKRLGNQSLQNQTILVSKRQNTADYNYSDQTIIEDSSVDIFMMIKRRYMKVHADGRL
ncbi:MAG: hypothetical protein CME63_00135 [Halobacteriovoraceae bacterium]|nr:hypothetical protein [Halobacteriovoraceae bacterium]MBC96132.1 hypothetical protein [Halobacteriovoraceae bacterium]